MKFSDAVSPSGWIGLGALWLTAGIGLALVPTGARVAIHWNMHGDADAFAPGWLSVLLLPLIATGILAVAAAVIRFSPGDSVKNGIHVVRVGLAAGITVILVAQCAIILTGLGFDVDVLRLAAISIGGLLLAIGNGLPKSQPNVIGGVRLPWTLRNEDNWRVTHRWTGRLMMAFGALLVAGALTFLQGPSLMLAALLAVLLPVASGIAISFSMARHGN